ncbi:MAG: hydrogenase [Lentisphaerae bacterium]|nr:hydrogenase [Lentisphaerota bacterium]
MNTWIEIAMLALLLSDMALLGLSVLSTSIGVVAFQGVLLGGFALLAQHDVLSPRLLAIAVGTVVLKGGVYPYLLRRAIQEAGIRREIQPFVGYVPSVLAGVVMMGIAVWLGHSLPLRADLPLVVPASLMTLFTGLFLVTARKTALIQCLGYLVLENGIYTFGVAAVGEIPALVELGLLLDAFVAVLVMGIAIYRINREFDHIEADRLNVLKG